MELFEEILFNLIRSNKGKIKLKGIAKVINSKCYTALQKIKEIICDDSLTDKECYLKIEEIICALENIGSNGGNRHDY